jgi:hypothetical protein
VISAIPNTRATCAVVMRSSRNVPTNLRRRATTSGDRFFNIKTSSRVTPLALQIRDMRAMTAFCPFFVSTAAPASDGTGAGLHRFAGGGRSLS